MTLSSQSTLTIIRSTVATVRATEKHLVRHPQKGKKLDCLNTLENPLQDNLLHGLPLDHSSFKNIVHFLENLIKKVFVILRNVWDVLKKWMAATTEVDSKRRLRGPNDEPLVEPGSTVTRRV